MRSIKLFLIFLSFVTSLSLAQEKLLMQKDLQEKSSSSESYPVDARPYLDRFNKANGIDEVQLAREKVLQKITNPVSYVVGSTKTWWASDLEHNNFYQTPSTCRANGTNCYVFVEDSLWIDGINGRVTQAAVDSVRIAFDSKTPANSSKGIYQTDVETFGFPPDVDLDPKIIIFILDIKDGWTSTPAGQGYVAGYFYGYNEYAQANSNYAEIYYLDANPLNLKTTGGIKTGMATTAHEFQHMIHFHYNPSQDYFINESMSMCAEVVNGYSMRSQTTFNNETNHYLFDWRSDNTLVLTDYARAARYSVYLYEQLGVDILKKIVQAPSPGINGIIYAFLNVQPSTTRRFSDALDDWFVANSLNDKTVDTRFGYTNVAAGNAVARVHINPNVTNYSDNVYKYGAQYITYSSGSNLAINFTLGSSLIKVKAIKSGSGTTVIDNVTTGQNYTVPDFGYTYNKVTFIVYITDQSAATGSYSFSYASTGTFQNTPQEIAYDNTEPTGYLPLSPGDSVAVVFDGILGAKLDSIKVAVRGITQLTGGVYSYVGLATRLGGKKLATASIVPTLTTPPAVINYGGDYPYEVPYKNWVKVDLRSSNIDASNNFVVEFPVGAAYPSTNRVMETYYQSDASYHSFFYQTSTGNWIYYSVDGKTGYIFLNLIRAYVSYEDPTGIKENLELIPSSVSLEQNYPNPFNPETVIRYQLPEGSLVTLKIYDVLGREVTTLVNEFQQPGVHNAKFSIQNSAYPSGVYIYRLTAGNYNVSKKMILMK